MALRSRKVKERTVEVSSSANPDDKLTVVVRALLETEMQWLAERNPDVVNAVTTEDATTPMWTGWMRDLVRLGLVDIVDPPNDPDTGQPFAIKRTQARVSGEKQQIVTNDTLNALAEYLAGIAVAIIEMAAMTGEEREAARPFAQSPEAPGMTPATPAQET